MFVNCWTSLYFFNGFIDLLERRGGRGGTREKHYNWLPPTRTRPGLGMGLTPNQTNDLLVHEMMFNQQESHLPELLDFTLDQGLAN